MVGVPCAHHVVGLVALPAPPPPSHPPSLTLSPPPPSSSPPPTSLPPCASRLLPAVPRRAPGVLCSALSQAPGQWGCRARTGRCKPSQLSCLEGRPCGPHLCPGQRRGGPAGPPCPLSGLHPCQGCAVKRAALSSVPLACARTAGAVGVPTVPPTSQAGQPPPGSGPGSCQSIQGSPLRGAGRRRCLTLRVNSRWEI